MENKNAVGYYPQHCASLNQYKAEKLYNKEWLAERINQPILSANRTFISFPDGEIYEQCCSLGFQFSNNSVLGAISLFLGPLNKGKLGMSAYLYPSPKNG